MENNSTQRTGSAPGSCHSVANSGSLPPDTCSHRAANRFDEIADSLEHISEHSFTETPIAASVNVCEKLMATDENMESDSKSLLLHTCPFDNNSTYDEHEDILEPHTEHDLMDVHTPADLCEQLESSNNAVCDSSSLPVATGDQADQSANIDTQHSQVTFGTHLLINGYNYYN